MNLKSTSPLRKNIKSPHKRLSTKVQDESGFLSSKMTKRNFKLANSPHESFRFGQFNQRKGIKSQTVAGKDIFKVLLKGIQSNEFISSTEKLDISSTCNANFTMFKSQGIAHRKTKSVY